MDTLLSLKVFCQVVQSGSFTKAAELLDISIPMASKHVAALEKNLGTQLLYRNNRSLKLTEQGEQYFRDCSHILELLAQANEQAQAGVVCLRLFCTAGAGVSGSVSRSGADAHAN